MGMDRTVFLLLMLTTLSLAIEVSDCVMEKELDSPPCFKGWPGSEGEKRKARADADRHFKRCGIVSGVF